MHININTGSNTDFNTGSKFGRLEVICGSMFSGKSEELIKRLRRAQIANLNTLVFKHSIDDRITVEYLHSHNGDKIKAIAVESVELIEDYMFDELQVIGIDEVQFFNKRIVEVICKLIESGKRVIVSGLDLDFRGMPFGSMPLLMAMADVVTKLNAVCQICGKDAHFSQRLVNGNPAQYDDPIVLIGADESYQARCRLCYKIDKKLYLSADLF